MRNVLSLSGLVVLSVSVLSSAVSAQADLAEALQQREQKLSSVTFVWQQSAHQHNKGLSPKFIASLVQQEETQAADRMRQHGKDEEHIHEALRKMTGDWMKSLGEATFDYSDTWVFQRYGPETLVSGVTQGVTDVSKWRQLYAGDAGFWVEDENYKVTGEVLATGSPAAWQSVGESIRYTSPLPRGSELPPEANVMLAGYSPLALHGATWSLVQETPKVRVYKTSYTEQSAGYPCGETVTLSRDHGDAPAAIVVTEPGIMETYTALSFRNVEGVEVADDVDDVWQNSDGDTVHRQWTLQKTSASQPIVVPGGNGHSVHDYRLLGSNVNWRTLQRLELGRSHAIVTYFWRGQLPSLASLKELHNNQYPGEATPDPASMGSAMPFFGGPMALAGAVWMFKRRGSPA